MEEQTPALKVEEVEPSREEDIARLFALKQKIQSGQDPHAEIVAQQEPEELGLPKILGHQLSFQEWKAFEAYATTGTIAEAAKASGLSVATIYRWRKEAWWDALFVTFIKERQQDLHAGLVALSEEAIDATRRVLTGQLEYDEKGNGEARYANAMMNAVQLLTKTGKNPLQDNRSITNIDGRTLINTGTVHISKERLDTLDQDDMLKMITGEVKIE